MIGSLPTSVKQQLQLQLPYPFQAKRAWDWKGSFTLCRCASTWARFQPLFCTPSHRCEAGATRRMLWNEKVMVLVNTRSLLYRKNSGGKKKRKDARRFKWKLSGKLGKKQHPKIIFFPLSKTQLSHLPFQALFCCLQVYACGQTVMWTSVSYSGVFQCSENLRGNNSF